MPIDFSTGSTVVHSVCLFRMLAGIMVSAKKNRTDGGERNVDYM